MLHVSVNYREKEEPQNDVLRNLGTWLVYIRPFFCRTCSDQKPSLSSIIRTLNRYQTMKYLKEPKTVVYRKLDS